MVQYSHPYALTKQFDFPLIGIYYFVHSYGGKWKWRTNFINHLMAPYPSDRVPVKSLWCGRRMALLQVQIGRLGFFTMQPSYSRQPRSGLDFIINVCSTLPFVVGGSLPIQTAIVINLFTWRIMSSVPLFKLVQRDPNKRVSVGTILELYCCLADSVTSPVRNSIDPEVVVGYTYDDTNGATCQRYLV